MKLKTTSSCEIMDLIPGLSNDLARECLIRVPLESFPSLKPVCKSWNREIRNPSFRLRRIQSGRTRPVFILADASRRYLRNARPDTEELPNNPIRLFYGLIVFDPESGSCSYLPPAPALPVELSGFSITGVVGVGSEIVVILAALELRSAQFVNLVNVFDFFTGQWRRGADLPGPRRCLFGLASDPVRRQVLVAGGYDDLRSAVIYDVAKDEWVHVADMEKGRSECSVVVHRGRFHVISGRSELSLSRPYVRMTCATSLDPDTLEWGSIDNDFLEASECDGHWVMGNGEDDVYQMSQTSVTVRRGDSGSWEAVTDMPNQLQHIACVMTWRDKMVVIDGRTYSHPPKAYVLDLKSREWTIHDLPNENLHVGCGMDL